MFLNKFTYIGAGLGVIVGAFLLYLMPLSKTELTALVDVKHNNEIAFLVKEQAFLQTAEKQLECAVGLAEHFDPRKGRNLNLYLIESNNGQFAKIKLYGGTKEILSCYLDAILKQYNTYLLEKKTYASEHLKRFEALVKHNESIPKNAYLSDVSQWFGMYAYLSSMMAFDKVEPYGVVSFDEYVSTKSRLTTIMFTALIGFVLGVFVSLFRK